MTSDSRVLLLVPSFYGALAWGVSLALYELNLIQWDAPTGAAQSLFILTVFAFVLSTILWTRRYATQVSLGYQPQRLAHELRLWIKGISDRLLVALHVIGAAGNVWSLLVFIQAFGGVQAYLGILFLDAYLIRQFEISPYGIYFGYLGWIAVSMTAFKWHYHGIAWYLKVALLIQIALNLLYIDRTRPVWLLFVTVMMIMRFGSTVSLKRALLLLVTSAFAALFIFSVIGLWVGKDGVALEMYGPVSVPPMIASIVYYLTGGFPYLDFVISSYAGEGLSLERALYPLFNALSVLGWVDKPPSQVLPFYDLPFPTNVGTFYEPYWSDAGWLGVCFALFVHSYGLNWLAFHALRHGGAWGGFFWATLCYVVMISFFVPKLVSAPVWLFGFMWLWAIAFRASPAR